MIPDSICLMPWIHLYIDTSGYAKACCNSSITYGNVNQQSVNEIWKGEAIQTFRKNLLQGVKDKRCASCFKREDANKSSIRTETLNKFPSYIEQVKNTTPEGICKESSPIYLDIRYSNVCNLKCRTCWHGASSSWFFDAKSLKNNIGDKAIIKATPNNNKLINELFAFDTEFEEIYFAGGEPLMMEEHYLFLDQLIKNKQTSVHLRYNTNLSTLTLKDKNIVNYWKQFSEITLAVSIDATHKKVEYIRSGLSWDKLLSNLSYIKEHCPHVHIEIAPTVSILSILTLDELHKYFFEKGFISVNDIYLNILDRPDYYNIKIAPEELKMKIQEKLEKHIIWMQENNAKESLIDEFNAVIEYMNLSSTQNQLNSFVKYTQQLDVMRNEKFEEIFPELQMAVS